MEGKLKFAVIANKNCVTYKNVFNYIKDNEIWSGKTRWSNEMRFKNDGEMKSVSAIWITNLEHGRRHQPMQLMTMADNKKFNSKVIKNPEVYQKYENYEAIEVPYTDAIPSDYDGVMGVPISFLDKYCPMQFKIIGATKSWDDSPEIQKVRTDLEHRHSGLIQSGDTVREKFVRILIQHKK